MKRLLGVLGGVWLCLAVPAVASPGEIAVIVNKANETQEVSFVELAKLLKQEKQLWSHGTRIYLVMPESGSDEKTLLLKKVYRMSEEELKKFWLGKLFREEIASFPKTIGSSEGAKRFVGQVPNAIGVIDAAALDDSVKALRIDGKRPGEPGYPLTEGF